MAKGKYYAVKRGRVPGIYNTWDECFEQTNGYTGALFKAFLNRKDAELFMSAPDDEEDTASTKVEIGLSADEMNQHIADRIASLGDDEVIAFTDGSYDSSEKKSAFGAILITSSGEKERLYNSFTADFGQEFIDMRNVAAEIEAVKEVVKWAIKYSKRKITIFYDYEGIGKFASGEWVPKNSVTSGFVSFLKDSRRLIDIELEKIPAHSGVDLNREVDRMAKDALLSKGHRTNNDGSVYFIGLGLNDWEGVIERINRENGELDKDIESILCKTEEIDSNRSRMTISQGRQRVTINCYPNSKSFVQGKQSVLFQKIIFTAVECLSTVRNMVETMNGYRASEISEEDVETRFSQLLPHYRKTEEAHHVILMSSVYNSMWTGYMPEYTCLVTPIFRAYEFYLHKILGEKMQLTTVENGINKFSYFERLDDKTYSCNKNVDLLNEDQLNYLNELYTEYNRVRHPYSHWSAGEVGNALIYACDDAKDLIERGLAMVDRYYTLF